MKKSLIAALLAGALRCPGLGPDRRARQPHLPPTGQPAHADRQRRPVLQLPLPRHRPDLRQAGPAGRLRLRPRQRLLPRQLELQRQFGRRLSRRQPRNGLLRRLQARPWATSAWMSAASTTTTRAPSANRGCRSPMPRHHQAVQRGGQQQRDLHRRQLEVPVAEVLLRADRLLQLAAIPSGTGYLDLSANYDLGDGWGINGHVGHLKAQELGQPPAPDASTTPTGSSA